MSWRTLWVAIAAVGLGFSCAHGHGTKANELIRFMTNDEIDLDARAIRVGELASLASEDPAVCSELVASYGAMHHVIQCPIADMFESDFHPCGKHLVDVLEQLRTDGRDTPEVYELLSKNVLLRNREFVRNTVLHGEVRRAAYTVLAIKQRGATSLANVVAEAVLSGQDLEAIVPAGGIWHTVRGELYGRALLDLRNHDNAKTVDAALTAIHEWARRFRSSDAYDLEEDLLAPLVEEIEEVLRG